MNSTAVGIFVIFVAVSLWITWHASARVRSLAGFYAAGQSVHPWQNGLAITGDYLSAASFLGTIAIFYSYGDDGLLYAVGAIAGWPVLACLIAEPLRSLGRYTFADAICNRLDGASVRVLAAVSTLCISGAYLVAQLVGAGTLIRVLFGIPYAVAVPLVGALMLCYVLVGGMVATTWVQIVKAAILLSAAAFMVLLLMKQFSFDFGALLSRAAQERVSANLTGDTRLLPDTLSTVSLALAFALGPAGLPHILMRFFTVADARQARRSLLYTSGFIGLFQILVIVLGFGAVALLPLHGLIGGPNIAAVRLAGVLGGDWLYGLVAAVTFATIVAVVAGVTLAAAASVSHDLYKNVFSKGTVKESTEIRISRIAAVLFGGGSVGLAVVFQSRTWDFWRHFLL
jgi:cation/acetate symporter